MNYKRVEVVNFYIKNFLSIEEVKLDFSGGRLCLFGLNSSGKTNIIKALKEFKRIIKRKDVYPADLVSTINTVEDTTFSISLKIDGQIYKYSYTYSNQEIILEILECDVIFTRDKIRDKNFRNRCAIKNTKHNELLLSNMINGNIKEYNLDAINELIVGWF